MKHAILSLILVTMVTFGAAAQRYGHAAPPVRVVYRPVPPPRVVYVAPAPVYVAPRPVCVAPRPVYIAPRPVYYGHRHHGHRNGCRR